MKCIAVLDSTFAIRNRIKALVAQADIKVLETAKPEQLVNLLKAPNDIGLIITELEFSHEDGLAILSKIMACVGEIPVMILTAENRRTFFVKGIQMGVSDYVLKPFDGEYLLKRVIDLMNLERDGLPIRVVDEINQEIPILNMDFDSYLDKELMKASKGKYSISIMMSKIVDTENKTNNQQKKHFMRIYKAIHQDMSTVLFDTDVFLKIGSGSFIGVFPFCGPDNQELIREKLLRVFKGYNQKNGIEQTTLLLNNFASYPQDGKIREELMSVVDERMMEAIRQVFTDETEMN